MSAGGEFLGSMGEVRSVGGVIPEPVLVSWCGGWIGSACARDCASEPVDESLSECWCDWFSTMGPRCELGACAPGAVPMRCDVRTLPAYMRDPSVSDEVAGLRLALDGFMQASRRAAVILGQRGGATVLATQAALEPAGPVLEQTVRQFERYGKACPTCMRRKCTWHGGIECSVGEVAPSFKGQRGDRAT